MKICFLPLDERPANTRYPRMLAQIAGVEITLPPAELLSDYRNAAPCDELLAWLTQQAAASDMLIVNCELLGYGGLIASRISSESAAVVVQRLEVLRTLKARHKRLRIFGFSVITRIPGYNSATEEPDYWEQHGADLHLLSQLMDRSEQGEDCDYELKELRNSLPAKHVDDFLKRRLRNHSVNLHVLQLAVDGIFDLLVISSDDTSPYGLGSSEKRWLQSWCERLDISDRVLMYPGADEVGSILVARAINQKRRTAPSFQLDFAVMGGEGITAAFEDSPVSVTLERQIAAAGASIQLVDADILLMVNPPRSSTHSWVIPYSTAEQKVRIPLLQAAIKRLAEWIGAGGTAAVADVAHSNGADPEWVNRLQDAGLLQQLIAYGAWNTAGNTIGTTVAQACIAWHDDASAEAQRRFLAHRLIEDWVYMADVRQQASAWLEASTGQREPAPDNVQQTATWIENRLSAAIEPLQLGYRIVPGSLRLPWKRTFEIDFDLEPV